MKEKQAMPSTYKEGVARVSHIVESVFPFEWEAKKRFEKWLDQKKIPMEKYMQVASSYWTAIHLWMENHINGVSLEQEQYEPFLTKYVSFGIQWMKDYNVIPLEIEKYIQTEHYQGTIDLIAEIDGEKWICDWKTYWIAQEVLNTKKEGSKYKKPYDKLKKAALQLSLYAYACGIEHIGVVELAADWYHFHKLNLLPKEEFDKVINNYIWKERQQNAHTTVEQWVELKWEVI